MRVRVFLYEGVGGIIPYFFTVMCLFAYMYVCMYTCMFINL